MTKQFTKKNIKLALQFGRYLSAKPERMRKIPNKGVVMFTIKGDHSFNRQSMSLAATMKTTRNKIVEARKEGSRWKILEPAIR